MLTGSSRILGKTHMARIVSALCDSHVATLPHLLAQSLRVGVSSGVCALLPLSLGDALTFLQGPATWCSTPDSVNYALHANDGNMMVYSRNLCCTPLLWRLVKYSSSPQCFLTDLHMPKRHIRRSFSFLRSSTTLWPFLNTTRCRLNANSPCHTHKRVRHAVLQATIHEAWSSVLNTSSPSTPTQRIFRNSCMSPSRWNSGVRINSIH